MCIHINILYSGVIVCVGVEKIRQFGRGTDEKEDETDTDPEPAQTKETDPDGFILVTGKKNRKKVYWDDSVLLHEQTRGDDVK
jgi:hypothetical protein